MWFYKQHTSKITAMSPDEERGETDGTRIFFLSNSFDHNISQV